MSIQLAPMPTMHSERTPRQSASQLMQLSDATPRQQEVLSELRTEVASQLRGKRNEYRDSLIQELRAIEAPLAKIAETAKKIDKKPQEIAKAFDFFSNLSNFRSLAERHNSTELERVLSENGFGSDLQFLKKRSPKSNGYVTAAKKTLTKIQTREKKRLGDIYQYGLALSQLQEYIRSCDAEKNLIPEDGEVRLAAQKILLLGALTTEHAENFDAMKAVYDEYTYDGEVVRKAVVTFAEFICAKLEKTRPPYLHDELIERAQESLAKLPRALELSLEESEETGSQAPTTEVKPKPKSKQEKPSDPYKNFGQKLRQTLREYRFPVELADVLTPDKITAIREKLVEAVHYKHIADELLGFFPEVFALAVEDEERFQRYTGALLSNRESMYADIIYKRFNPSTYEPSVLLESE